MSKKRIVQGKSFRLIDFHIFNKKGAIDADSEDSDENHFDETDNFIIQMFGINEKGETCCIYLDNYKPFFYIKVGDDWTQKHAIELKHDISQRIGKYHAKNVISAELIDRHQLYGFTGGNKTKFVKFTFNNTTALNKVKSLWYRYLSEKEREDEREYRKLKGFRFKNTDLLLYESTIPPLLRYFHIHNVSPSGWVFVTTQTAREPAVKTTTCTYEYVCNLTNIKPMPNKETIVPYKICSFDIEASSSHGDFPLPIKTYKRLATNIVDMFMRIQKSSQKLDTKKGNQLLKRCILTAFNMDKFEDVDIVYPKTKPTKKSILSSIEILLSNSVNQMMENKKAAGLDIETIFEKIKDNENTGSDTIGQEETGNNEVESVPIWNKMKPTAKLLKKNDTKQSVVDVLLNDSYEREDKIKILNTILQPDDYPYPIGHPLRLFPNLEGDKVTFIGSTFLRYGEKEPYLNHCLVLGGCDPVDGAVIEIEHTEKDLLIKWRDLIQKEDPDVIIGYNIFGFDYEFMFRRSQETGCVEEFLQLSRIQNEVCAKEIDDELSIENTKIVLATGEYDLRFYKTIGRLQIDMYTYFRREFNLASYKLDNVAGQYISDSVKHIKHTVHAKFGEVTELYSKNLAGLHTNDFIHIELSGFTSDYYKDGKKFKVLDIEYNKEYDDKSTFNVITIQGNELTDQINKKINWCVAKDDVSVQDIFRLSKGSDADRSIVAKYCIQDCNLVHHLMMKTDVLTGYVEMASICSVPISFLVFRGQGIKLTSFVAKKCREKNTLMPDLEKTKSRDGYEGAIVLPPKCSMYMDNPVACVDYASLYPSSMISQNYSHDSKVWTKEYDLDGNLIKNVGEKDKAGNFIYDNLPGYQYIDIDFDTYTYRTKSGTSGVWEKVKVGRKVCRWAQLPDNQKSIMPAILEELLAARKSTRTKIKTEPDPFMQNILDKRQLGYKVTANSLYGQCGARTSTFYEQDVAASTTATGRMMIIYAKRMIEEVYGDRICNTKHYGEVKSKAEYVYGDTDSVFFTFNLEDMNGQKIRGKKALEITIELAQEAANLCTQFLKAPQCLEYEKTLMPFILLSKKRYVGMLYEEDANKGNLKYMGLSLKRRDSCDYLKDTYGGILNILMNSSNDNNNIQDAIEFLYQSLNNLIDGTVPMEKLSITKALRSDYKNPMQIGHWVLAERIGKRDPGNRPKPGDRMKFVFIVNKDKKALMGEKMETTEFILENKLPIDYTHYITNQLMKPLQQLFGLALEPIWEHQNKTSTIKTYRKDMLNLEKEYTDMEVFMKKKEKYCSTKIKTMLFDKFLTTIAHKQNGMQNITQFFQ
jgi:DNA polymerase elongation subunit (family B)